jgi:hypothetical protein
VKVTASTTLTHNPWGEAYWASGLRENLTSRSYGEGLETGRRVLQAPRQSLTRQLVFKAWKSHLHLATLPTTTKNSTLCYLYGRMLLIVVTFALGPTLRATVWQKQQREVSLVKLVRHFQAGAEQWLQVLFPSSQQFTTFLSQACAAAERLVRKAVRNHRTSAQRLRDSLGPQVDFFEPALALAA